MDSTDEVGWQLNLVRGLGRALLREKMMAQASACLRVIVDDTRLVSRLAERARLPVEVVSLEFDGHRQWLEAQVADPGVRRNASGEVRETMTDC